MRLTQEQAAAVDAVAATIAGPKATVWMAYRSAHETLGVKAYDASARILDLLDLLLDTTARLEQSEKDLALLARHLTRQYEPDAFDALKRGLEHSMRLAGEAHESAAKQDQKDATT